MPLNPLEPINGTKTTTKLLDALRDLSNEPAWAQIDSRYRPVVTGLARRLGLNQSDAEEVAQQTLTEFVRAYRDGRYDRTKGRLSSWILGIAHHTALRLMRTGGRAVLVGDAALTEVADEPVLRSIWADERDREILSRALQMLRDESAMDERTLNAFELVAIRGVPVEAVASQCGMSVDQVYVARSRATKRLRRIVEDLTSAFEEDA